MTVVPNAACSPGARACGSPLHATHLSPRRTTPSNQRSCCSSVPIPSRMASEFAWPSQQRASERSAFASSFVISQSVSGVAEVRTQAQAALLARHGRRVQPRVEQIVEVLAGKVAVRS